MDYRTWMRRGWCRLELLANAMSPTQKNVILAESSTQLVSHGPKGIFGQSWFSSSVGKGEFTVPLDRGALGPVINGMLNSRKEQALAKGDMTLYRFIHASTVSTLADGTSVVVEETLDEWMEAMKFKKGGQRPPRGLTSHLRGGRRARRPLRGADAARRESRARWKASARSTGCGST